MKNRIRVPRQLLIEAVVCTSLLSPLMGDVSRPLRQLKADHIARASAIDPDDWKSFAAALRQRSNRFHGTVGYIVKDLRSGEIVATNPDYVFPSASLIKLPILVAAYQAVEDDRISLSQPVTLRRQDRRSGSGVLKWSAPGSIYTLRELLEYMIIHSDNTAAEMIIQQLGFDYLRHTFARLGLQDTEIHPDGFRLTSRRVAEDNRTTPRDMAFLLEKIYLGDLVSRDASEDMMRILNAQKLRDRLPRYLPSGWKIAHKTGLLRRACHDVGIVFSPKGDYLICVLTSHQATYKNAKRFIASIGRITYDYYQGGFHRPMLQSCLPVRQDRRESFSSQPAS